MNSPTVCILTAGRGSRMGEMSQTLNKALFPVNGKAIITHIIEKFPISTNFVIGLGFLGEQVCQYLNIAHKDQTFIFQTVDNFDGPGSGPGHSLFCCAQHLQKPFYFVSCDTLWDNRLDWKETDNWLGVDAVDTEISVNYCNVKIKDNKITEILDKTKIPDNSYQTFVGLCFIKDYQIFLDGLKNNTLISGEHQISNGLQALIKKTSVMAKPIQWIDAGDEKKFREIASRYENFDFSKKEEALYLSNTKVIKFFSDRRIVTHRVQKSKLNPDVFPFITDHEGQFYTYDYQKGQTLYQINNGDIFQIFLRWLDEKLWIHKSVDKNTFQSACMKFYKDKTLDRLNKYHQKYPDSNIVSHINGEKIPSISELFNKIPWDYLSNGIPCFIHGDLQFDNVLYDVQKNTFLLLDWRQDFCGYIEFGDLYYDFAKLFGGIVLNYDYIKLNLLTYQENNDVIFFDFAQRFQTENYLKILTNFICDKNYDVVKVRLLTALIFLNMSPLHHYPFDKLLYAFGRRLLFKELKNITDKKRLELAAI